MEHVLFLGGGVAAVTAAEALKKERADLRVTIVDREGHPLYSRVLLPHYVKGKVARERVFLKKEEWYVAQGIEWRRGEEYTGDPREEADTVVIAMGTHPPMPAHGFALQTLEHADALRATLMDEALEEGIVLGGGFMAAEFVNMLAHYRKGARVYVRDGGWWNMMLPEEAQRVLSGYLFARDIPMLPFAEAPTDHPLTLVGLGSPAQLAVAKLLGLKTHEGGILTDEYLRTSLANIYAIGDVATAFSPLLGRALRITNWQNAMQHGRALAKTLLGQPVVATAPTSYATELLGHPIVFLGDCVRGQADSVQVVRGNEECQVYYVREGKLVGAALLGNTTARQILLSRLGQPFSL